MNFGSTVPFSLVPFSAADMGGIFDSSTEPLIYGLLKNPDAPRFLMLHLQPIDRETDSVYNLYYGSGLSRIPGIDVLWQPRLVDAYNVQTDLFAGPFGIGGTGRSAFGAITIATGEEVERLYIFRDFYSWLEWHQRPMKLYLGGHPDTGWTWSDYIPVFSGLSQEVTFDEDRLTLVVRDPSTTLEVAIQSNDYKGTGTYEGDENLKGQKKPLAYGRPKNVTPVLVDRFQLIYQVHDGPIFDVIPYDRGDQFLFHSDTTNLYSGSVPPGRYRTDLSRGLFQLGSTPTVLTADVVGENHAGVLHELQGDLIHRILVSRGGFVDSDDYFDFGSIAVFDQAEREVAIYLTGDETISSIVDDLLLPSGFRAFDANGRLVLGRIEFGPVVMTLQAPRIVSIRRVQTPSSIWRLSLGYAKNWTVMSETNLAAAGAELDKDFATHEYRRVTNEDLTVKTRNKDSEEVKIDTLLVDVIDAQEESTRAFDLFKENRDLYEVVATRIDFLLRVGQTIRVVHQRFGLFDGRNFIVIGLGLNSTSGLTQLSLWG